MTERLELLVTVKDSATGILKGIGHAAGAILKGGLLAATGGATALAGGLAYSIKQAMDAQKIQAQLAAVLKSTGGAAGVTADMANDLANSLSGVTTFEDDAILSGENMLLTFTNIGKDVFPAATQAMLDMSTATGQDLVSSSVQLGKALNDPIAGISALSRVGVTFTEDQKKMIEKMVEAGDVAGAQTVILEELGKEFGGSAKAAGETFGGQLTIVKNSLGNVAEEIGGALLPALSGFVTTAVLPFVQTYGPQLAAWFGQNLPVAIAFLSNFFNTVLLPAITTIWTFLSTQLIPFLRDQVFPWLQVNIPIAIQTLSNFWNTILLPALQTIWGFISGTLLPLLINQVFPWLKEHIPEAISVLAGFWNNTLLPAIKTIWGFISGTLIPLFVNDVYPWLQEKIPAAISTLSDFWNNTLYPAIYDIWLFIYNDLLPVFLDIVTWLATNIFNAAKTLSEFWNNTLSPAIKTVWEWFNDHLLPIIKDVWEFIRDDLLPIFQDIGNYFNDHLSGFLTAIKDGWNGIKDAVNFVVDAVKDVIEWIGKAVDAMPDWLIPGSPTPFEMGIRGISDAMKDLSKVGLPSFAATFAVAGGGAAGAGTNNNYWNLEINAAGGIVDPVSSFQMLKSLAGA